MLTDKISLFLQNTKTRFIVGTYIVGLTRLDTTGNDDDEMISENEKDRKSVDSDLLKICWGFNQTFHVATLSDCKRYYCEPSPPLFFYAKFVTPSWSGSPPDGD